MSRTMKKIRHDARPRKPALPRPAAKDLPLRPAVVAVPTVAARSATTAAPRRRRALHLTPNQRAAAVIAGLLVVAAGLVAILGGRGWLWPITAVLLVAVSGLLVAAAWRPVAPPADGPDGWLDVLLGGVARLRRSPSERPAAPRPLRVVRITASSPWYETGLLETFRSWELIRVFTWRQIGVQYKQATLGIGWALLSPLLSTLVFSFVFGTLGGMASEGFPYPVFVLSGIITWQYFARTLSVGSNSIVGNSGLITKVYFQRMILPLSVVLSGLVDYVVTLVAVLAVMVYYHIAIGPGVLALPVFVLTAALLGFAISLWLSALNALYRDINFMIPIVLQAWMFMTPVIYPATQVPASWQWIMHVNPMTPVIEGARWAILSGGTPPDPKGFAILAVEMAVLLVGGVVTFRKIDAILVDRI